MAKRRTNSWREIRDQPLDEHRVAFYRQLIVADERLEERRRRLGVSEAAFDAALEPDPGEDDADDLYCLLRCVELLGGTLEVRAVFDDGPVTLLASAEPPQERR